MLPSGCAGFPLGYPSRADVDINTKYTYLVQDRRPDAPVCQPGRQDIPGNNPFPPASVTPGQNLHLTWQPDGHLDDARPSLVEVHWTGIPGRQLHTRSELSSATLLGVMTFATSDNCDQPWEPNTWCHGHLTIPWGTQPGTYQLIWWWKYDRNPSGEEYSTCFEIVVNGGSMKHRSLPADVLSDVGSPLSPPMSSIESLKERDDKGEQPLEPNNDASMDNGNGAEALQNTEALTALTSQPDEPLPVIPDPEFTHNEDIKKNQSQTDGYIDGETGTLAGDVINDQEGVDTSPLPTVTPSQLINNTLSEQIKKPADSNGNGNGSLSISEPQGIQVTPGSNSTPSNTTRTPALRPGSSSTGHGPLNQTSMGQTPALDSGASDITSHSLFPSHCMAFFACVLATLTWMLV